GLPDDARRDVADGEPAEHDARREVVDDHVGALPDDDDASGAVERHAHRDGERALVRPRGDEDRVALPRRGDARGDVGRRPARERAGADEREQREGGCGGHAPALMARTWGRHARRWKKSARTIAIDARAASISPTPGVATVLNW